MKKRILAIVLSLVLVITALSGCSLITKNDDRVQQNAVVSIGNGETAQTISASEISTLFSNYGIYYVYYYGLSVTETMELLIDSLLTNKLLTISAMENMPKIGSKGNGESGIYDQYFTAKELNDIAAKVEANISTSIENTEKETLRDAWATASGEKFEAIEVRTTPTGFEYLSNVPFDFIDTDSRNAAFKKFKRKLVTNGTDLDKYKETLLVAYKQEALLSKYKEVIEAEVDATDADVVARYNAILEKETEAYAINKSAYLTKLKAIASAKAFSGENFVLSVPEAGYGFNYNLVLPFSDEQAEKLKEYKKAVEDKEMTEVEYEQKRQELLDQIVVKDLRESWLLSYGANSELFKDNAFDGVATPSMDAGVQALDEKGYFKYDELKAKEYTVTEFLAKVQSLLGASASGKVDGFDIFSSSLDKKDEFLKLVWAYNSDSGMFNNTAGYLSYVDPDASGYVAEYANASKAVTKAGEGNYTIVGTDFGWHIIFTIASYDKTGIINEYKASEKDVEGTFSNEFFNEVVTSLKTNYYNEKATAISASYQAQDKYIKINQDELAKLITSISASLQQ